MATSPLSLQEARSPASFGFQETQFTSWLWALVSWAASENTGSSGLAATSSLKTRTASSPQAVARAPVSRHLNKQLIKDDKPGAWKENYDPTQNTMLWIIQLRQNMGPTHTRICTVLHLFRKDSVLPGNIIHSSSMIPREGANTLPGYVTFEWAEQKNKSNRLFYQWKKCDSKSTDRSHRGIPSKSSQCGHRCRRPSSVQLHQNTNSKL